MSTRFAAAAPALLFLIISHPADAQLPVHTIEGVGGGAITPIALVVNSGRAPAFSTTVVSLNDKNLETFAVTQSFGGRVEFGYATTRLDLGDLRRDITAATTVDINRDHVLLHHFNVRAIIVPQGSFVPAIALGASLKYNSGVDNVDVSLAGALQGIAYDSDVGVDFTLTATKIVSGVLPKTFIVSAGGRASRGAWAGLLGFANKYTATFEGNFVYLAAPFLTLAYEFRQMPNPYTAGLAPLIGEPGDWHTVDAIFHVANRFTVTGVLGVFGNVLNKDANTSFGIQFKNEF